MMLLRNALVQRHSTDWKPAVWPAASVADVTATDVRVDPFAWTIWRPETRLPLPAVGNLSCLRLARYLDVHSNLLLGPIPTAIGSMTSLAYFDASSNALTSTLPTTMAALTRLTT